MDELTIVAPAKLNLRLLVGPGGRDGYHPVRSLMVTLDGLGDVITIGPAEERQVACPGLDGSTNLAWAAIDLLERHVGRALVCRVEIDKRIPTEAGLGGGSSDAAAVMNGLNHLFALGLDPATLEALAADLGSDVPFFIRGGAQWATGRGEHLTSAPVPRFAALIAQPATGLSTARVYAAFDALPAPMPDDGAPPPQAMPGLADWVRNDLWAAACGLCPELVETAAALRTAGARTTLLCGSGSAVAGLFDDTAAAHAASERCPGMVGVVSCGLA